MCRSSTSNPSSCEGSVYNVAMSKHKVYQSSKYFLDAAGIATTVKNFSYSPLNILEQINNNPILLRPKSFRTRAGSMSSGPVYSNFTKGILQEAFLDVHQSERLGRCLSLPLMAFVLKVKYFGVLFGFRMYMSSF